jgi:hypothetical protein
MVAVELGIILTLIADIYAGTGLVDVAPGELAK